MGSSRPASRRYVRKSALTAGAPLTAVDCGGRLRTPPPPPAGAGLAGCGRSSSANREEGRVGPRFHQVEAAAPRRRGRLPPRSRFRRCRDRRRWRVRSRCGSAGPPRGGAGARVHWIDTRIGGNGPDPRHGLPKWWLPTAGTHSAASPPPPASRPTSRSYEGRCSQAEKFVGFTEWRARFPSWSYRRC